MPLIPTFSTGTFVPGDGPGASVDDMLDQVIAWSSALRTVRNEKAKELAQA